MSLAVLWVQVLVQITMRVATGVRIKDSVRVHVWDRVRAKGGAYFHTHNHARQGCQGCGLTMEGKTSVLSVGLCYEGGRGSVPVATPDPEHSTRIKLRLRLRLRLRLGEWVDQVQWPRQTQYTVNVSSSSFSCHNIIPISLLERYYSGAIN